MATATKKFWRVAAMTCVAALLADQAFSSARDEFTLQPTIVMPEPVPQVQTFVPAPQEVFIQTAPAPEVVVEEYDPCNDNDPSNDEAAGCFGTIVETVPAPEPVVISEPVVAPQEIIVPEIVSVPEPILIPEPVVVAAPPPTPIVAAPPAPIVAAPPPPVVAAPPPVVAAPVALGAGGLGGAGLVAAGIGVAALVGIAAVALDDDDDNSSSTTSSR